jgi:hypothetical protein
VYISVSEWVEGVARGGGEDGEKERELPQEPGRRKSEEEQIADFFLAAQ